MELANVNHYAQVKLLFDEYNIPYEIITRGQNKGKLRVKPLRNTDRFNLIETKTRLENAGFDYIVDHSNCFRDADDNTICTFSPYTVERRIVSGTDDGLFSGDPVSLATHSDRGDMYFAA